MNELFTIGYANFSGIHFLNMLNKCDINFIVDVRSWPYSNYKPVFNRESLKSSLADYDIGYLFLGDNCGARTDDETCYVDNRVDYDLLAKSKVFMNGLERIHRGLRKYRIALMCAENDPITCHRDILICRNLKQMDIKIRHIIAPNIIEVNEESEQRLLNLFFNQENELFADRNDLLNEAYTRQGILIAY